MKLKNVFIIPFLSIMSNYGLLINIERLEKCNFSNIIYNELGSSSDHKNKYHDSRIILIINHEASVKKELFCENDFPEIKCEKIEDLTISNNLIEDSNKCFNNFKRILLVTLKSSERISDALFSKIKANKYIDDVCFDSVIQSKSESEYDAYVLGENYYWGQKNVSVDNAWVLSGGSNSINVAVIDTGIKSNHVDLSNNINTLIDSCFSPDFSTSFDDISGHGTHVSGIIGAESNSIGSNGVCKHISIIPYRVSYSAPGQTDNWYESAVIQSLSDISNEGIDLVNFSGGGFDGASTALQQAFQSFPGLIVCSSGNNSQDNDINGYYPASFSYSNIISVGSINMYNIKSGFSNYGINSVDLYAPGEYIYSTDVTNSGYSIRSGTSMAAPFVTGAIAILKSINPNLTGLQLKNLIMQNVDYVSSLSGLCVSGGKLNVYKAALSAIPSLNDNLNYSVQPIEASGFQWYKIVKEDSTITSINSSGLLSIAGELYTNPLDDPIAYSQLSLDGNNFEINNLSLPPGTYYLKVSNCGNSVGNYTIYVNSSHVHDYTFSYEYFNFRYHKSNCFCGNYILKEHVRPIDYTGLAGPCIYCGWNPTLFVFNNHFTKSDYYIQKDGTVLINTKMYEYFLKTGTINYDKE